MKISMKSVMTILALIPYLLTKSALAACAFAPDSPLQQVINITIPLNISIITVGPDHALGVTDVFSQYYRPGFASPKITCSSSGQFYVESRISTTPLPLSSWNSGLFAGIVYESGVPGLGAVVYMNRKSLGYPDASEKLPSTAAIDFCRSTATCIVSTGNAAAGPFTVALGIIHTGAITPGVIQGANLPCTTHRVGLVGDTLDVIRTCFSGAITVVSQTCTTPNVDVSLGTFDTKMFTGIGSTTTWIDSSITLTNCPQFYGRRGSGVGNFYSDDGRTGTTGMLNNSISVKFTPITSTIDSQNGVIGLKTGETSASGVGIQIATGTVGGASPVPINIDRTTLQKLENDGVTTVRVPLVARYIQTGSTVKPGRADASATFTINYF